MEIDEALKVLDGYLFGIVACWCNKCKREFYTEDDTTKFCPHCGGKDVEVIYEKEVQLLDWGWRRYWRR